MKIVLKNRKGDFWACEAGWVKGMAEAKVFAHATDVVELSLRMRLEGARMVLWFGPGSPLNMEIDVPSAKAVAKSFGL